MLVSGRAEKNESLHVASELGTNFSVHVGCVPSLIANELDSPARTGIEIEVADGVFGRGEGRGEIVIAGGDKNAQAGCAVQRRCQ